MSSILILHATHQKFGYVHKFIEYFGDESELDAYIRAHPYITVIEIARHELNPN